MLLRLAIGLLGFALIMASAWTMWRVSGNAGFVDSIWTFGVSIVAFLIAFLPLEQDESIERRLSVAALVALWGLRLGTHIWHRSRTKGNDPRYMRLLEEWGPQRAWRMFVFLQIQALCSLPLFIAVALAAHNSAAEFGVLDGIALLVAGVAVIGEGVADEQLRRYQKLMPHGTGVCDIGLWRYCRHPNYFFEFLLWCAFPLFALSGAESFAAFLAMVGPICMYWLLVYVSGVPPLEEHMLASRGQAYRLYQQRTNVFFPLPLRADPSIIVSGDNIHFEHAFEQPKHQSRGEG